VIVVDASCLYEVVVDTPRAEAIRERLAIDPEQAAPHIVDIEVFGLIRRDYLAGTIDETLAALAVEGPPLVAG
jgi:predicted nucleic acid-binding protein